MNIRDTADFDTDRASLDLLADRLLRPPVPASRDARQHPLQHHTLKLVTVAEVIVGLKRHLRLAVGRSDPRPLDPNPPTSQRHHAVLMTMPDRGTLTVPPALRPNHPLDLLLQKLPENPQPNLDRQRQQPLPRSPHQLPQRILHALREHALITDRLSDRYGLTHGGSSLDLCRIARHTPTQSGRAGGTAVTSKFYEPRDNLRRSQLHRRGSAAGRRVCGDPLSIVIRGTHWAG